MIANVIANVIVKDDLKNRGKQAIESEGLEEKKV